MSVLAAVIIFGILAIIFFGGWLFAPKWLGWRNGDGIAFWYGACWMIPLATLGTLIGTAMNWKGN